MFILPGSLVKQIITGEVDYDNLPYNLKNERLKGYRFEDQARKNLLLADYCQPVCRALSTSCKKGECPLFANKSGNIPDGWVCREYQLDFPTAPFDLRYHVALIGVGDVDIQETKKHLEELVLDGARYICLGCKKVYATKPEKIYDDGHGGRMMEMCSCDSDLFGAIGSFIKNI